jgi:4-amino-4-deoxy-L-arabinose transferase-like glycosyltransferase
MDLPGTTDAPRSWRNPLLLWVLAGGLTCAALGAHPVARTQEARVLETAREMLGSELHNWLIPRVNGHIRLQKPPLAYWLTAGAYKVLGVSEGVGRIPAAVAGWLTVGVTALMASWLFGRRAGFFAGAALLGSFLFFRFGRQAETDVLAALFVTAAVYFLWRGYGREGEPEPTFARSACWYHAAGAAIGLAVLAKGPPAGYPVLFFLLMAAFDRRWDRVGRFLACGAPLTAVLIALPWFLYVRQDPDYLQLVKDLKNSAGGGRGHSSLFITYVPALFVAAAPWSALMPVALIAAASNWRRDRRLRGVVVWLGAMLVPLSFWGNKQLHYLMPVMPAVMVLVGWLLDAALRPGFPIAKLTTVVWALSALALAVAAPAAIVAGRLERGHVIRWDFAMAALLLAGLVAVALAYRRRGLEPAMVVFAAGAPLVMFAALGLWEPSLEPVNCRTIAPALGSRYGEGPYAFVGKEDLPLVFHMQRIIPVARSSAAIARLAGRQPPVVAIEPISGTNRARPVIEETARFVTRTTIFRIGYVKPGATTLPASGPSGAPDDEPAE